LLSLGAESSIFQFTIKKTKFKIHKTIILPVVLYGCETWSLTLKEERRLRDFENRVLKSTFGSKRNQVTEERRRLRNERFYALYFSQNIIRVIKSRRMRWDEYIARRGRGEIHSRFWWENLKKGVHSEDPSVDGRIILKWVREKCDGQGMNQFS
jgi:hypothetical protein